MNKLVINVLICWIIFFRNMEKTGMTTIGHSSECSQFHAVIVWDTNTDVQDISFMYHKRFLYALIDNMPEGSYIVLKTTGDFNELDFRKDSGWTNELDGITFSFTKEAIPYSMLRKTVKNALSRHETADMDIQLFLLVNDISRLDNEEKALEALMIVNTFVVFTGMIQPQNIWTDLASDEKHLYITDSTNDEKFFNETEHFLNLSCQNSRLDCGISMYLNKSRCYKCAYICGRVKNTLSQFCLNTCPNFDHHLDMPKDCHCDMSDCEKSSTDPLLLTLVIVLSTVIVAEKLVLLMLTMCNYFEAYGI
ncbi:uncharacterized protein LOC123532044 [Mercenaria mercenaria]|uniref:uncharacterized protein LOC123532044 n=1 Tax=Mercenaria mercenaria TaxID=6596 RepID=UPI00234E7384|nr:uncharacterized protein LOC123532044 [Mercenaria mercenaria]